MKSMLKWNKTRREEFIRVIKRDSYKQPKFGVSCIFVKLNKVVGVKVYATARERNRCHKVQTLAATHGAAPAVGDAFEFECCMLDHFVDDEKLGYRAEITYRKVFCYLTQVAELHRGKTPSIKNILALEYKLYKAGLVHDDLHRGNIGYVNNKMVCIDFDFCSCSFIKGRKPNAF